MSGDDSGRRRGQQNDRPGGQSDRRTQPSQSGRRQQPGQGQQGRPQRGQPRQQEHPQQGQPGQRRQQGLQIDLSTLPWISGALNGVGYFVSTYITLGLIFVGDIFVSLDNFEPEGEFFVYGVGWRIYDSFFVTIPSSFDSFLSLVESELVVPGIIYTAIAALFLFLAGRSVARSNGTFDTPNEQMALYGATVAVGYTLAAIAGAIILEESGQSPDLVESILFIGVVFPVVFGGLGGYLAKR